MFQRRNKRVWHHNMREFVWPQMGWRRATRYIGHRVARLPGSPYSIAGGFACGAAISFTPFVGLHFVLSALLAWAIRANILASAIGTAVGNPWTFPFIWFWIYQVGCFLTGRDPNQVLDVELTIEFLWEHALDIFVPMLIGSIPTALIVWLGFYWPLKYLVAAYQRRRVERRSAQQPDNMDAGTEKEMD